MFFVLLIRIIKYLNKHLQIINVYYNLSDNYEISSSYNPATDYTLHPGHWYLKMRPYVAKITHKLTYFYPNDIISYYIIQMLLKLLENFQEKSVPHIILYYLYGKVAIKRWQRFVIFSPLLFIFYDLIFNNFVISHVFPYLLLYTPLILIKRLTIYLMEERKGMIRRKRRMYYKKETDILYAATPFNRMLIDLYLVNNLSVYLREIDPLGELAKPNIKDVFIINTGLFLKDQLSDIIYVKKIGDKVFVLKEIETPEGEFVDVPTEYELELLGYKGKEEYG